MEMASKMYLLQTEFVGSLSFDKPLAKNHLNYLKAFHKTRRVSRVESLVKSVPDPIRKAAKLPIGTDCSFFTGSVQINSDVEFSLKFSIKDSMAPPGGQPTFWCSWLPTENGESLFIDKSSPWEYLI